MSTGGPVGIAGEAVPPTLTGDGGFGKKHQGAGFMTTHTEADTSHFADVGEWTVHYNDAGSGEPVIMIHGSGPGASGWANFNRNFDAFVDHGYRVILLDCPGFNKSDPLITGEPRFTVNARAIMKLMDHLKLDRAHLVGNSMGGGSAIAFATIYPERLGKLVLMGSGGVGLGSVLTPTPMEGIRALLSVYQDPTIENLRRMLDVFVYNPNALTPELVAARHANMMRNPTHLINFLKSVELSKREMGDFSSRLSEISADTLIIWGRDDRFVPLDWGLKMLRGIPSAEMHIFSQCGHWAQWEHAERFNELVISFLKYRHGHPRR